MSNQKRSKLPRFASREEEATFWETHDLADFEDELTAITRVHVARPLEHTLSIPLDAGMIGELAAEARRQQIGLSELVRVWLAERLAREREANGASGEPLERARSRAAR